MSGLAGAFDAGARPIDRDAFAAVVSHLAYRGPDGISSWHGAGVSMAFAASARTPDAEWDRQPRCDPGAGTCVAFDGRLDNRDELAGELGLPFSERTPDAALVAAAYARWALDAPARLLGDFALAIWDHRERRVLLARDVMGVRPLFHRQVSGVWWWASDVRALLCLGIPAVNEGYLAEHLSDSITSIDETLYRGVYRVPMAHALCVGADGSRRWRYWRPVSPEAPPNGNAAEYEEQFRTIFRDAVRVRLRAAAPVTLMLSGGIDSCSIAAEVAAQRDAGDERAARVRTVSMTMPGSHACEGAVIQQVLTHVRLPSAMFAARQAVEADFVPDSSAALDLPEPPTSITSRPLREAAAAAGSRVVLTGYGGDEWFDTSYGDLADLLRRGRLVAAHRWVRAASAVPNQIPVPDILRLGVWMALPDSVKAPLRTALRRDPVPAWIDPAFARRHRLADRLRHRADDVEFASRAQYDAFRAATGGDAAFRNDQNERFAAALGLEERHPLIDRRLIEFALGLPAAVRSADGLSKRILRRAMTPYLPPAVTGMPPNTDFGFLVMGVLDRLGGAERIAASAPVRRGWVRPEAIRDAYRRAAAGGTRYMWPVWSVMAIDVWLRALEQAGAADAMEQHGYEAANVGT